MFNFYKGQYVCITATGNHEYEGVVQELGKLTVTIKDVTISAQKITIPYKKIIAVSVVDEMS